jgi:hypothetical protein
MGLGDGVRSGKGGSDAQGVGAGVAAGSGDCPRQLDAKRRSIVHSFDCGLVQNGTASELPFIDSHTTQSDITAAHAIVTAYVVCHHHPRIPTIRTPRLESRRQSADLG